MSWGHTSAAAMLRWCAAVATAACIRARLALYITPSTTGKATLLIQCELVLSISLSCRQAQFLLMHVCQNVSAFGFNTIDTARAALKHGDDPIQVCLSKAPEKGARTAPRLAFVAREAAKRSRPSF